VEELVDGHQLDEQVDALLCALRKEIIAEQEGGDEQLGMVGLLRESGPDRRGALVGCLVALAASFSGIPGEKLKTV
jgi:hypothetical protein